MGIDTANIIASNFSSPYTPNVDCWFRIRSYIESGSSWNVYLDGVEVTYCDINTSGNLGLIIPVKSGQVITFSSHSSRSTYIYGVKR